MAEEQRGFYSLNGTYPQELPDYWKSSDGNIRTDLHLLSDDELKSLGWLSVSVPPIDGTSFVTHDYSWNSDTISFDPIEVDEFEKRKRVDYKTFWSLLIDTSAYSTIKEAASQSLLANTLATEFIALMSDAKRGQANIEKIQQVLTEIVSGIPFTPEDLAEIQEVFEQSGMSAIYTLE